MRKEGKNRAKSLKKQKKSNPNKPEKQISQTKSNHSCVYYEKNIRTFLIIKATELHRLAQYKKFLKFALILLN